MSGHPLVFNATVSHFGGDPARPAEVFLNAAKPATDLDVAARDCAILISMLLQYGVALKELSASVSRGARGEPQGVAAALCDAILQDPRP